ncbi:Tetratricopeptide repeat-containing protein [Actinokineospora iranica]|uniref:Tetratricopeptide repeat-containing protein n=2 Tax=Actinokineospora iranica TaxID=1271860 RepID=A0A1G6TLS9_9PSEU|nr:Tetratricopeptide repeat-containing protein [Actinokineospora iranica]
MAWPRTEDGEASFRNAIHGQVSGQVVQTASVGAVHFHGAPAAQDVTPSQLPPAPTAFVARERELALLDGLSEPRTRGVAPIVIRGVAGVGKTSLALRWMHELAPRFDDGRLFVNLSDPGSGEPVTASEVLEWFLLSLGVAAERIPLETQRRYALYRSVTAHRQILVLLDNAVSASQVRPLLPAGQGSVVVVTSRSRLSGLALDGARWLDVDPLDHSDSLRLLRALVGDDRVGAESEDAVRVASFCGGLPLALSVVAARLASRARRTFAREAGDLSGEGDRLAGLTLDTETSVEVVLDMSLAALLDDEEAVYRLCAWHPGREFGGQVLAAALDWPEGRVVKALDGLVEASLLTETGEDRFALHDLVRLHARHLDSDNGQVLQRRMTDWYLDRAAAADTVVHPRRPRLAPVYQTADGSAFTDTAAALGWLTRERANLRAALESAASRGWDDVVWQFCETLWGYFLHTRRYGEWIDMQRVGVASARHCGDRRAEALIRIQLGYALTKIGRRTEAVEQIAIARDLARTAQDPRAEATALEQLGLAVLDDDPHAALDFFSQARDLHQRLGRDRGVALCRRRIGEVLLALGRYDDAVTEFSAVAEAMAVLGDPTQHARAVTMLGAAHSRAGRLPQAERVLRDAFEAMREFGSAYYQAEIAAALGDVSALAGDQESAVRWWDQAATLYDLVEDPKAELMRSRVRG